MGKLIMTVVLMAFVATSAFASSCGDNSCAAPVAPEAAAAAVSEAAPAAVEAAAAATTEAAAPAEAAKTFGNCSICGGPVTVEGKTTCEMCEPSTK